MKYLLVFLIFNCAISSVAQTQSSSIRGEDSLKSLQIISKYIDALGNMSSISSLRMTLTGKTQGIDSEMKIIKKAPNKFSVENFLNGKSISKQICDGDQFIMLIQDRIMPLDLATIEIGIFEWSILPEMRLNELNIKFSYKGSILENNVKYELIEYQFPKGHKILNYFDSKTGLKVKTVREQASAIGNISLVTRKSDYRDVQGFKFPYEFIQSMGSIEQKMLLTSIEINIEVDEAIFKTDN